MPDRPSVAAGSTSPAEPDGRDSPLRVILVVVRVALPLTMAVVGVAAIVVGHARTAVAGAGVVLLGAAVIVWMINWLFRLSVESNRDRDREEQAREYFDLHGYWPGEEEG